MTISGFTTEELWEDLRRRWQGYRLAESQNDLATRIKHAKAIRAIQHKLGVAISEFPDLNLMEGS